MLTEEQMEYARNDVRYLHQLKDKLAKELEAAGLTKVFEMERRLLLVTAAMEVHGFSVNIEAMRALKEEADRISGDLAVELRKDFKDEQLNPGSNPQLLRALKKEGANVENANEKLFVRWMILGQDNPALAGGRQTFLELQTPLKARHQARIYSRLNPLGTVTGRFRSK